MLESESSEKRESPEMGKIVFSYDYKDFRYKTNFYRAKMTRNRFAKHEILNFFQLLYKRLNGFKDLKDFNANVSRAYTISMFSILIAIFFLIYGYIFMHNTTALWVGGGLLSAGITYGIIYKKKCQRWKMDVIKRTRDRIYEYFQSNKTLFESKNIKWNLPQTDIAWIEFHLGPSEKYEEENSQLSGERISSNEHVKIEIASHNNEDSFNYKQRS